MSIRKTLNMTQIVMVLAGLYCKLVYFFRCRLRNKSDFNYFITNLRLQYPKGQLGDIAIGKHTPLDFK